MTDLFTTPELLPKSVQDIIESYGEIETYIQCERLLKDLQALGYEFDYYLDAIPYNLTKIN